jgi:hypothetical protein
MISFLLAITGAAPVRFGVVATSQGVDAGAERTQRLEAMEALARSVAIIEVANVVSSVALRPRCGPNRSIVGMSRLGDRTTARSGPGGGKVVP